MAIVLVEQYFDFAYDLGGQFYALRGSVVILNGTRDEVTRPELLAMVSV
ncbi:MAG: urea transport system ATP-binding protein [Paracoccaceae bacterium]|jgi:urea transport system ATP-binding protein